MGASDFYTRAKGKTAREAFDAATADARYTNGHGGYTGTIAEKSSFKEMTPKATDRKAIMDEAYDLVEENEKWGPAFCFKLGEGEYLFFGFASD